MSLTIVIPPPESFDYDKQEFVYGKGATLQLEHSLVSLHKWEQKWHIPFLDKRREKTTEQTKDYIKCMTLTQNVDPEVYDRIDGEIIKDILAYIDDSHTATFFGGEPLKSRDNRPLTAEVLYYEMISLGIPFECKKWHLNSLLTLIHVCREENNARNNNGKGKKRRAQDISMEYARMNAQRMAKGKKP